MHLWETSSSQIWLGWTDCDKKVEAVSRAGGFQWDTFVVLLGKKWQSALNLACPGKEKKQTICIPTRKNLQLKYTFFLFNPKINPSQQKLNSPQNVSLFTPRIISTTELVRWTLYCTLSLCTAKCQGKLQWKSHKYVLCHSSSIPLNLGIEAKALLWVMDCRCGMSSVKNASAATCHLHQHLLCRPDIRAKGRKMLNFLWQFPSRG